MSECKPLETAPRECPLGEDCDLTLAYMMGAEKAKDIIKAQAKEIKRLHALLGPFAKAAESFDGMPIKNPEEWFAYRGVNAGGEVSGAITIGDLRRARAAFIAKPAEGEKA
jgi:hypothetical protein